MNKWRRKLAPMVRGAAKLQESRARTAGPTLFLESCKSAEHAPLAQTPPWQKSATGARPLDAPSGSAAGGRYRSRTLRGRSPYLTPLPAWNKSCSRSRSEMRGEKHPYSF